MVKKKKVFSDEERAEIRSAECFTTLPVDEALSATTVRVSGMVGGVFAPCECKTNVPVDGQNMIFDSIQIPRFFFGISIQSKVFKKDKLLEKEAYP